MPENKNRIAEFAKRLAALEQEWNAIKNETEDAIARMKEKLRSILPDGKVEKSGTQSTPKAGERPASFPYPVGKLVKTAFPELFRRQLLSAGDIAYLLSPRASKDFRTRGCPVLRMCAGEDDPGLYTCGHRRYYKMPPLELGSKKYHLSSQFYPESTDAVLKWIYRHGLKKAELLSMLGQST